MNYNYSVVAIEVYELFLEFKFYSYHYVTGIVSGDAILFE